MNILDSKGLFNPHCNSLHLLECLRKKCDLPSDLRLDLVDKDGNLANLSEHLNEFASWYLEPRKTYILIKITVIAETENSETDIFSYEPLLNEDDLDDYYPDLINELKKLSRPLKIPIGKHLAMTNTKKRSGSFSMSWKANVKNEKGSKRK